jgi:hypothetical protein
VKSILGSHLISFIGIKKTQTKTQTKSLKNCDKMKKIKNWVIENQLVNKIKTDAYCFPSCR